jgi:hypothetical protein
MFVCMCVSVCFGMFVCARACGVCTVYARLFVRIHAAANCKQSDRYHHQLGGTIVLTHVETSTARFSESQLHTGLQVAFGSV